MNIDIYSDNPKITLAYQAAVMQAALEGKPVQCNYSTPECPGHGWWPVTCPGWDWSSHMYRIDPASSPRLAVGHNPDGLTEEQVGVKDGWRLLVEGELANRNTNPDIQMWMGLQYCWNKASQGVLLSSTYRTKQPPGFFLPKVKVRVPLVSDDLPSPCWIRPSEYACHCLVTTIDPCGGVTSASFGGGVSMRHMMDHGYQFSSDRKTWHPCWKEV